MHSQKSASPLGVRPDKSSAGGEMIICEDKYHLDHSSNKNHRTQPRPNAGLNSGRAGLKAKRSKDNVRNKNKMVTTTGLKDYNIVSNRYLELHDEKTIADKSIYKLEAA